MRERRNEDGDRGTALKRLTAIILLLALALTLAGCGRKKKDEPTIHTVRIGVLEPLSGSLSAGGRRELLGVRYAHSLTNSIVVNRETYSIELVTADCGSTEESARTAAEELAAQDICAVIGCNDSMLTRAAGPVFEAQGIAMLGAGCTDEAIPTLGSYCFCLCCNDAQEAKVLADVAWDRWGGKVAYVVSVDDEEGRAMADRFRRCYEERGGSVFYDTVRPGTTEFTPYFERAISAGASVVYLALNATYAARAVNQAAAISYELPLLGSHLIDDPRIPIAAGAGSGLRIYCGAYCRIAEDSSFVTELRAYLRSDEEASQLNAGAQEISTVTAMGYDAYNVLLEAIRSAASADKADLLARLPAVIWRGISGLIRFDDNGAARWERMWVRKADVENGVWVMDASFALE